MARMHGYRQAEEIVGMRLDELLPHSVQENLDYLRTFIRSRYQLTDAEYQEVDLHGGTKYLLYNLTGAVEDGFLVRAWGTQRDITEHKHTEETLRYQLDLTKTIVDNAADSLFLWDAEGRVMFMNPAAEQTFGWRQEELLGEVLHNFVHHHYPDGQPYPVLECPLIKGFG